MDSLNQFITQFHFIRPWLLSIIPAAIIFWFLIKRVGAGSQWQDHLPKAVIDALQISKSSRSKLSQWCWLIAWLLISFAAAGPSWLKQTVPVIQNQNATVIILDLSQSMLAKDLTPNRLTLAKYKLIDVLRHQSTKAKQPTEDDSSKESGPISDGQLALIAYSGDAYTVSPLTDDPNTIEALLPALHPNLMPSVGSNIEASIDLATQLLSDAGIASGHILLLSDGVASSAFATIKNKLSGLHKLSILGVGSNEAAPVPLQDGGFLRKGNGEIVLAALNASELQTLARSLGGKFAQISSNETDLNFLLNDEFSTSDSDNANEENENRFDAWTDMGHWLVILLIPLFLIFFRKGLIYCLPLLTVGLLFTPSDSYAASLWDKLWKNPDQRASKLIQQQDYEAAAQTFKNKEWAAHAAYKNADYQKAIEQLNDKTDIQSLYNKGNALALNGDIDAAIESYKSVLENQADHADAKHNLDILEKLKQQQNQQQDGEQQDSDEQSDQSQQQSENDSQQEQPSEQEEQDSSSQSQSSDEQSEQQGQQPKSKQDDADSSETETSEEKSQQQNTEASEEESDQEDANKKSEPQSGEDTEDQSDAETDQQRSYVEVTEPLKDSSEQWLRSIEDDPSGLLRRKFEYQALQRQRSGQSTRKRKDDSGTQRY